ncbi:MAG: alpha/beta fold hydrolase, partial [Stackebrandtia sp.]
HEGFVVPDELLEEVRLMTFHSIAATMQASTEYLKLRALPDRLTTVGKPLLVVFGDADRRWDPASAADYRSVPGARIHMLPGTGHSPLIEAPAETAARLQDFAAGHRSG